MKILETLYQKEEQDFHDLNISLDFVITALQEHRASWVAPVSSHKLQSVREMGTETTELCTSHVLYTGKD